MGERQSARARVCVAFARVLYSHGKINEGGQKVMLDFELAEIYGYTTKAFNQQVKNNASRFDDDFRFKLRKEEVEILGSKNLTSSWGGSRYLPYAFTEQGIYMLMTVLKGELAIRQSKALIRTFKRMKDYILINQELINQKDVLKLSFIVSEQGKNIADIEKSLGAIDNRILKISEKLDDCVKRTELSGIIEMFQENELKKEYVLWDGQPFDADIAYSTIYQSAKSTIYVVDNYIGIKTLVLLKNCNQEVQIILFSDNLGKGLHNSEFKDFCDQYPEYKIELKQAGRRYHDRYIIIDYKTEQERIFHCGPSSKDGGKRIGSIVEIREKDTYHNRIEELIKMPQLELK